MCHDHDSRPPAPPRTGDVAERGVLTLTVRRRHRVLRGLRRAGQPARVGVVVLPDIRGLHPYYVALAERFAEAGAATVAIDYFGRTAGLCGESGTRGEDFDWQTHIPQTTPEGIDADITAAIAYLREPRPVPDLPVVTVGFCFGGSHSWRQSGGGAGPGRLRGLLRPARRWWATPPTRAQLPTVMLIAGADAATPTADQLALADTMRAAGADVDAVVYDGAPHSFFDRAFGEWA